MIENKSSNFFSPHQKLRKLLYFLSPCVRIVVRGDKIKYPIDNYKSGGEVYGLLKRTKRFYNS
ncbi:MAG: hypothetical protein ACYCYE_18685, partial [Clostridia bacterium]